MHRQTALLIGTLLISTPALAADPLDGMTSNWTGLYLGAHVGGAWGEADVRDTNGGVLPGPFSYDPAGVFGGATAGFNWQLGRFVVLGIEGDIGYMDLSGSGVIPSANPDYHQDITLDGGLYGDVTGRVGIAVGDDNTLIYVKGGGAYYDGSASQKTTFPGYVTTANSGFTGYVYGGGIEHKFSPAISVKAEYLHFDFSSVDGYQTSISDEPIGYQYDNTTDLTAHSVKLGVALHY